MRRSELAALDVADLEETADGLVTIRRSKTDQEGHGDVIAIPRGTIACPVAALHAWLQVANITAGPVFRPIAKGERISDARLTDRSIAAIVKAHAARVRLDPGLCRSLVAFGLPHQRRGARRIDLQDGRPVAAQEHGHAARLCPRCRDLQGSCRRGPALS
jgi:hypothetical protein